MYKQLFYKVFILIFIMTQLISVQCILKRSFGDEQLLNKNNYFKSDLNTPSYSPIVIYEPLHFEEIKREFKKIDNDFDELMKQINNENEMRYKRAAPREKKQECVVSKSELSDLKTVIDSAMTNLAAINVNCNYNTNKNNNCNELLKLIQCGISNIQNEYNKISTSNPSSNKEYQNLLSAYNMLNSKYLKIIDDVKALSDQKYKQRVDKLTGDMQHVAKQLQESKDVLLKKTIELCAFKIHTGNIEDSIKEYHNLMANNKIDSLPKIIDKAYKNINNENKESNIKSLLKFIEIIPQKCEQFSAYLSLISKMQQENHLNCYLSTFWNHLKTSSTKWNSQNVAGKITECPNIYIEDFNTQLQTIINHIYRNCFPNAENAIQFIDELLTNDQKVIAYPILFEEMKKRNGLNGYEIVLLGFRIQEIIITQKSENIIGITKIKDVLPPGVKVLMSAGAVRLKSKALTNSNFALNNMLTSSCIESIDQYQDWVVRVHQRGRYFQFINVANVHSLRADLMKTFVTTGFCDRHLWEIIPTSNGASFFIRNKFYGNILGVNLNSKVGNSNNICYQVRVFNQYTGDAFQQWEIKHKM